MSMSVFTSLYLNLSQSKLSLQLIHLLHSCANFIPQCSAVRDIIAEGCQYAQMQATA